LFLPRGRTLPLPWLNLIRFLSAQLSSLSRACWTTAQPTSSTLLCSLDFSQVAPHASVCTEERLQFKHRTENPEEDKKLTGRSRAVSSETERGEVNSLSATRQTADSHAWGTLFPVTTPYSKPEAQMLVKEKTC